MVTPKKNYFLFVLFNILSIIVFILSLVFPQVRTLAYAPLRELILPPPKPITINMVYSTEKEEWLGEMIQNFEQENIRYNGHPIEIKAQKMGSREMILAIMDGEIQPDLISPASSLQTSILENLSQNKFGTAFVESNNQNSCIPMLKSPLVLVTWRDRASVLWGDEIPDNVWKSLHDAITNPQGWGSYGKSEWGYVKFGQTNPLKSNSGFMTILLMAYAYYGKSSGLTVDEILNNPDFQQWFLEMENGISDFGDSTGTYMRDIIAYGPSVYDIVAVYEATAIEQADNAIGRYGELRVYYPPLSINSDHPFCLINAEWVDPDKTQAAKLFLDYLKSEEAQNIAVTKYGFRPTLSGVTLDQPGSPFTQYATNGIQINTPPEIELPDGNVLNILLDFWSRNISP